MQPPEKLPMVEAGTFGRMPLMNRGIPFLISIEVTLRLVSSPILRHVQGPQNKTNCQLKSTRANSLMELDHEKKKEWKYKYYLQ
mmetsp:Transcript_16845/g.23311  ORF Transcript_16845/g.23311 Transcript_16845/m.23311 type:complete len:84 (+) Transcript_16845:181-432(+)